MRELLVPGGRDHLRRAPVTGTGGSARGDVTILRLTADRARAVCVDSFFLTDAVDALRLKETNGVERLELFVRELVHEQLPRLCSGLAVDHSVVALYDRCRVIRAVTHEFGETDGDIAGLILCLRPGIGNFPICFRSPQLVGIVVRAEHEAPIELVVNLFLGDLEVVFRDAVQHRVGLFGIDGEIALSSRRSLRIGADHVAARQNGHRRADRRVVILRLVVNGVDEHVVHRCAGVRGLCDFELLQIDGFGDRAIVRILRRVEDIIACIQLIAGMLVPVRILPVPGRHVVRIPRAGDGLRFAGRQKLGLLVVQEADLGLLDTALRIRSFHIELHDVLAGNVARVLDGDGSRELRVGREGIPFHLHGEVGPLERGVGQTVAERIDDVPVVPVVSARIRFVALAAAVEVFRFESRFRRFAGKSHIASSDLGVHRLVVLVAEVDAFLVFDRSAARARFATGQHGVRNVVVIVVILRAVAEVLHDGIRHEVARIDVDRAAGGIDLALEHFEHAAEAVVTRLTDMDDRVDLRVVLQLAELDDVARVEEDDDLFEMLFDVLDQLFLSVGKLEVMILRSILESAVFAGRAHVLIDVFDCKVRAFAAETTDDDERRVIVTAVRSLDGLRIISEVKLLILVCRGRPLRSSTHGAAGILLIQRFEFGVDVQALSLEGRIDIRTFFELTGAGTRAAVAERVGVDTEYADIFHIRIRQLVLVSVLAATVLQENRTLSCDLDVFGFGFFFQLFIAGERRVVMAHAVVAIAHCVFLRDLGHRKGRHRRTQHRDAKYDHK